MLSYEAGAEIDAPVDVVWSVLTSGESYPEWDSGVTRVEGRIVGGGKIKVFAEISPDRAFPVKVALQEPEKMTWTGGMPLGLFKGVRTFTLEATESGTKFHTREEFTGPLLGMISRSMPDLQPSFDRLAAGLKAESERLAGS